MLNPYLEPLCNLCSTSGDEGTVRGFLIEKISHFDHVSWHVDALGNLLVQKRGMNRAPHKLMISAHMDEVGLIVTHINADGTLCIAPVGGIDASVVIGRQVLVGEKKCIGVIGAKPVHLMLKEEKDQLPQFGALVLDIGAQSETHAAQYAPPGTFVYFMPNFYITPDRRIMSKAIDDRFGCAALLRLLEQPAQYDFTAAFLVQEEIGLRGAKTAAFAESPEFAIVLEATTAADLAGAEGDAKVCSLGNGPVISIMDRATIYDREMVQAAFSLCRQHQIFCQTKSRITGGNDSGAIHVSRNGVRTLSVSLPCRYLHAPTSLADLTDAENCEKLLPLLITEIMENMDA